MGMGRLPGHSLGKRPGTRGGGLLGVIILPRIEWHGDESQELGFSTRELPTLATKYDFAGAGLWKGKGFTGVERGRPSTEDMGMGPVNLARYTRVLGLGHTDGPRAGQGRAGGWPKEGVVGLLVVQGRCGGLGGVWGGLEGRLG